MVQFEPNISKSKPNLTESESFINNDIKLSITETNAKTLVVYLSPIRHSCAVSRHVAMETWRRAGSERYSPPPRRVIPWLVNNASFYSPARRRARQC